MGIALSKLNRWSQRLGTPNQHNAIIPRDFWLEELEKIAIVAFRDLYGPKCMPKNNLRRGRTLAQMA